MTLTWDLAFIYGSDLLESGLGEIKIVVVATRRASIGNGDLDTLAVLGVRELDAAAAVRRLSAQVSITLGLCD